MSRWRSESIYLGRYAGSGVLNTLVGFSIIFMMMGLGASPVLANVCGYLVGLVLGFMVSKKLVFRSQGHFTSEGLRYLAAFLVCFLINLIVLKLCLDSFHWHPVLAQCVAAVTYTAIMYLLSRFLVFKAGMNKAPADEQE